MINLSQAKGSNATSTHLRRGAMASCDSGPPSRSLERTQPQRAIMCEVETLHRSARSRWRAADTRVISRPIQWYDDW